MTAIRKMRIHGFGGKEVLRADDVEPSLPNAAVRFQDGFGKYRRPMRGRRRNCRRR